MTRYIVPAALAAILLTTGCSSEQGEPATQTEATEAAPAPVAAPDMVNFSKEMQQVSKLEIGPLQERNLSSRVPAKGQLSLPPQGMASVSPLVGGMVRSIHVIEGDYVQKGKVLATIENPDLLNMQESYLSTHSQLSMARQELERQQMLADEQVGALKRYQQAGAEVKVLQAKLNSLREQLQTLGISLKSVENGRITRTLNLTAPISGYVQTVRANLGSYAEPNQPILQIIDDSHLHLDLNVFEKDFAKLEKGQRVVFTLPNVSNQEVEAEVFAIGKSFEGETRAVPVHAEIKNNKNKGLLPGMYINGFILTGKHQALSVPEEAIVLYQSKPYIFQQVEEATFKMIPVETGVTESGFTEVKLLGELPKDAQVVQKGASFILSEKLKFEVPEE
ncbi:cobalt-zinc-cadmium efflux system membrane fusion protein [Pontibacter mucosus]|uniref:Cobalt-zinc-cadmium efflux system membrane fusion protein n=1 Tax=Pontibacter mucosus TaxID=1649266 RepID=A0A2T5YLS7_9BACT|nr:efflux RND transporter periplasmic adaptor subunit [Pontibacter mucosus]PTX20232.1 cobalt-zinc-cadmium efflux system membrane fusion protein [Pontibacter mucosus]